MRQEFIQCKSRSTAKRRAPWAAHIAKVDGGFMAFESTDDYRDWKEVSEAIEAFAGEH